MTDDLNKLIANVKAVAEIGKQYSEYKFSVKVNLYQNLSYRRVNHIYYYEATEINNALVKLMGLSHCIRKTYLRVDRYKNDVIGLLLIESIERYTEVWELALEKHKHNEEVQRLLNRYAILPGEMMRMIEYTDLVVANA